MVAWDDSMDDGIWLHVMMVWMMVYGCMDDSMDDGIWLHGMIVWVMVYGCM